jgi:hypothetical protein
MASSYCTLVTLGLLAGAAGQAKGQPGYLYTTFDVPGAYQTYPQGLNDSGQIVGYYLDPGFKMHGFIFNGSSYTTLDAPGAGGTYAGGINASGQIVGGYGDARAEHGFLLSGSNYSTFDVPESNGTYPRGINASGQIAGQYRFGDLFSSSFLYSGGSYTKFAVSGTGFTAAAASPHLMCRALSLPKPSALITPDRSWELTVMSIHETLASY